MTWAARWPLFPIVVAGIGIVAAAACSRPFVSPLAEPPYKNRTPAGYDAIARSEAGPPIETTELRCVEPRAGHGEHDEPVLEELGSLLEEPSGVRLELVVGAQDLREAIEEVHLVAGLSERVG